MSTENKQAEYYPCFECLCRFQKQYTPECDNRCAYAMVAKEKKELEQRNGRILAILFRNRLCPECGRKILLRLESDITGTEGVFECECGFTDRSIDFFFYATEEEKQQFKENTKNIMW